MDSKIWSTIDIDVEQGKVSYLGYELGLTPDEYEVVCAMAECLGEIDDGEFWEMMSIKLQANHENVAVHVCNINKKAIAVGGRRIIVKRKHHYIFDDK